jgi:hypothetical protein
VIKIRNESDRFANTFLAPAPEGGTDGIHLEDSNSQGSLFIFGGAI